MLIQKKTISLTVSIAQYDLIKLEAAGRGLEPSEFVKMTIASFINKSSKGAYSELARVQAEKE